jgi:vitamin B12 transporter
LLSSANFEDNGYGTNAKLSWKHESHNVVLGADYDSKKLESNTITNGEQKLTKLAFFINDTMSLDRLSVTPGIRQDHTDTNGNFTSPSLGMTYKIADATLLRAYAARGFNIPPLSAININPNLNMEKVWSYELGAETTALKHLWLKLSAFRHEIRDAISPDITGIPVNQEKQRRQGMEIEMKTAPVYHTSLSAGAAFINVKDLNTGETVLGNPQRTYDLGLQYDDQKSFKALLKGHYIYWNSGFSPNPSFTGKYNSFIFDLHVMKDLYSRDKQMLEAFMDIHNIFNSPQYPLAIYKNPERWFEAGIRCTF